MGDAEVCVCSALRRCELLPSRDEHLLDWEVAPRPAWAEGSTKIEESRVAPVVVREPPAVPSRHGEEEGAVLEYLGQWLAYPSLVYRLVLVDVPYQDPFQATKGKLTLLRPAGAVHHRIFINRYPASGVFAPIRMVLLAKWLIVVPLT